MIITLMMETIRTSDTSVYSNDTTRRNIPEGSYTRRRENLKCRMLLNKLRNHQHNICVLTTRPPNTRPSERGYSVFSVEVSLSICQTQTAAFLSKEQVGIRNTPIRVVFCSFYRVICTTVVETNLPANCI
jgi:hypothetical protein